MNKYTLKYLIFNEFGLNEFSETFYLTVTVRDGDSMTIIIKNVMVRNSWCSVTVKLLAIRNHVKIFYGIILFSKKFRKKSLRQFWTPQCGAQLELYGRERRFMPCST